MVLTRTQTRFHRVNRAIDQSAGAVVSNDSAYKHVSLKLDSARTHLLAAGAAFVFDPGPGFTGFNTPRDPSSR